MGTMKKILIVEDETSYLELLSSQLTKSGYQVIESTNGQDGLKQVKKHNPDLILLDIRMPVMDGMTMLDLLRKEKIGKEVKVILLTNLEPDDKITSRVLVDRPEYYFVKSDIKLDELLDKIKDMLEK
jgi:CheY-like chemotaxis protein